MATTPVTTAQRLSNLARVYQRGPGSPLLDRVLDKALSYETEVAHNQLAQIRVDLGEFEQRYQQSSDEFYRQFQVGQTDDRLDYTEWAVLIQMRDNLQERLHLLTGDTAA